MPDFYYIDFYFDPAETGFKPVVDGCISALTGSGARFKKILMSASKDEVRRQVSFAEHVRIEPADIGAVAAAYMEEYEEEDEMKAVTFPPMGRVMFEFDFRFDTMMLDEMEDEERDTRSSAREIGLTFLYTIGKAGNKKPAASAPSFASMGRIKASMSMWEEYVLTHGNGDIHAHNMRRLISIVDAVAAKSGPYFGAMNNEIHLDTDRSLDGLMRNGVPAGNEMVVVGPGLRGKLNMDIINRYGFGVRDTARGGAIVQLAPRWKGIFKGA